jgi:hypothetical protein
MPGCIAPNAGNHYGKNPYFQFVDLQQKSCILDFYLNLSPLKYLMNNKMTAGIFILFLIPILR